MSQTSYYSGTPKNTNLISNIKIQNQIFTHVIYWIAPNDVADLVCALWRQKDATCSQDARIIYAYELNSFLYLKGLFAFINSDKHSTACFERYTYLLYYYYVNFHLQPYEKLNCPYAQL